jgi:hypothetical protein
MGATFREPVTISNTLVITDTLTVDTIQMSETKGGLHLASGGTNLGQAPLYFAEDSDVLNNLEMGALEYDNFGLYITYRDNASEMQRFTVLAGTGAIHGANISSYGGSAIEYAYGSTILQDNTVLGAPDYWIRINFAGESLIIPAYYEAL